MKPLGLVALIAGFILVAAPFFGIPAAFGGYHGGYGAGPGICGIIASGSTRPTSCIAGIPTVNLVVMAFGAALILIGLAVLLVPLFLFGAAMAALVGGFLFLINLLGVVV